MNVPFTPSHYQKTTSLPAPVYSLRNFNPVEIIRPHVAYDRGILYLQYDVAEDSSLSTALRSRSGRVIIPPDTIHKIPHEFVQASLSPVQEGFRIGLGHTPDIVLTDDLGRYQILEITTVNSSVTSALENAVTNKLNKYAYMTTIPNVSAFNILAVGLTSVMSLDASLDIEFMGTLIRAYRTGLQVLNEIRETFGILFEGEDLGSFNDVVNMINSPGLFPDLAVLPDNDPLTRSVMIDAAMRERQRSVNSDHKISYTQSEYEFNKNEPLESWLNRQAGKDCMDTVVHLPMLEMCEEYKAPEPDVLYNLLFAAEITVDRPTQQDLRKVREQLQETRKVYRSERKNAGIVYLTDQLRLEVAQRGVLAKALLAQSTIQEARRIDKEPYSGNCRTQDIKDFHYQDFTYDGKILYDLDLIRDLSIRDGTNYQPETVIGDLTKCKYIKSLWILEQIVTEVILAMKLNPDDRSDVEREFIYKDVPGTELKLCIRTTNYSSDQAPIFFSVYSSKAFKPVHSIFERVFNSSGWYHTKFVSLDKRRAEHLVNVVKTQLSLWAYLTDIFTTDGPTTLEAFKAVEKPFRLFSLLYLQDKEFNSTNLQHLRFYYMELIGSGSHSRAEKITGKLGSPIRSRLFCYIMQELVNCKETFWCAPNNLEAAQDDPAEEAALVEDYEKAVEDDDVIAEGTIYKKLIDKIKSRELDFSIQTPFGCTCTNFEQILAPMYSMIMHNKNEQDAALGSKQIVEKIIKLERTLPSCDFRAGDPSTMPEPHRYRDHDWSYKMVKFGAELVRDRLTAIIGETSLAQRCTEALKRDRVEELATTKSTSLGVCFDSIESEEDLEKLGKRSKCFEAFFLMDFVAMTLIDNLPNLVSKAQLQNFRVLVQMFKKAQWNGVREILILDFLSRCLTRIIETIARELDSLHPYEYLTNSKEKMDILHKHNSQVRAKAQRFRTTFSLSLDKTNWCQLWVMPVFYTVMSTIVPEFEPLFCFVLNMHTRKVLEIPSELVESFYKNPNSRLEQYQVNELKREFLGLEKNAFLSFGKGSALIRNRSNMMQGILHYVSSLAHCCVIEYIEHELRKVAKMLKLSIVFSGAVSSDDSGPLITISSNDKSKFEKNEKLFSKALRVILFHVERGFCMRTSIYKSTLTVKPLFEFNSVFYSGNNLIPALIKFVITCCYESASESLRARVSAFHSSLRELRANGASGFLCSFISTLQCICNLSSMGYQSMEFFDDFYKVIKPYKLSTLGHYLALPPILAGLTNTDYQDFHVCKESKPARDLHTVLLTKPVIGKNLISEWSLTFSMWPTRKYRRSLMRLKIDRSEVRSFSWDMLEPMFRAPAGIEEMRRRVMISICNGTVARSFSHLSRCEPVGARAYMLWDRIFSSKEFEYVREFVKAGIEQGIKALDEAKPEERPVIRRMLQDMERKAEQEFEDTSARISLEEIIQAAIKETHNLEMHNLFPAYNHLESIFLLTKKDIAITPTGQRYILRPHRYSSAITALPSPSVLKQILGHHWFGLLPKIGVTTTEHLTRHLKEMLPWFNENREICLVQSGFTEPLALINYIVGFAEDNKPMSFISSGFSKEKTNHVEAMATLNTKKFSVLSFHSGSRYTDWVAEDISGGSDMSLRVAQLDNRLRDHKYILNRLPAEEYQRHYEPFIDLDMIPLISSVEADLRMSLRSFSHKREASLYLSILDPSKWITQLEMQADPSVVWITPQTFDAGTYYGYGECVIIFGHERLWLEVQDGDVIEAGMSSGFQNPRYVLKKILPYLRISDDLTIPRKDVVLPAPKGFRFYGGRIWLTDEDKIALLAEMRPVRSLNLEPLSILHLREYPALAQWVSRRDKLTLFNKVTSSDKSYYLIKEALKTACSSIHNDGIRAYSIRQVRPAINHAENQFEDLKEDINDEFFDALFEGLIEEMGEPDVEDFGNVVEDWGEPDLLEMRLVFNEEIDLGTTIYHPLLNMVFRDVGRNFNRTDVFGRMVTEIEVDLGISTAEEGKEEEADPFERDV